MVSSLIAFICLLAPVDVQEIMLVLNKAEDTVSLIDTVKEVEIKRVPTGHGPNEVMVSPGGQWATIANMGNQRADKTITVLRMPGGDVARTIDLGSYARPHGMAFLDHSRMVVTTHEVDALHIVDVEKGVIEKSIVSPYKGLHMVVLSPDKKMAYGSCVFANKAVAFDLVKGEVTWSVDCGLRAEGISISPDGKTLAVGNMGADTVSIVDVASRKVTKTLSGMPQPIRTFFVDGGSRLLVSSAGTGEVVVFDTGTWEEKKRIVMEKLPGMAGDDRHPPMNYALSRDGKRVFVVVVSADLVAEIDLASLTVVKTHKTGKLPDGIAVWTAER